MMKLELNTEDINAFQEIINIGVGQAAGVLNDMLSSHINLYIPQLEFFPPKLVKQEFENRFGTGHLSTVELDFDGSLAGHAKLVFPTDSALKLVHLVMDETTDDFDMDSLKIGVLTEVGNIVISGVMGAMSNLFDYHLEYLVPYYLEGNIEQILDFKDINFKENAVLLIAQTHFNIQDTDIHGDIILIFGIGSFPKLINAIHQFHEN